MLGTRWARGSGCFVTTQKIKHCKRAGASQCLEVTVPEEHSPGAGLGSTLSVPDRQWPSGQTQAPSHICSIVSHRSCHRWATGHVYLHLWVTKLRFREVTF